MDDLEPFRVDFSKYVEHYWTSRMSMTSAQKKLVDALSDFGDYGTRAEYVPRRPFVRDIYGRSPGAIAMEDVKNITTLTGRLVLPEDTFTGGKPKGYEGNYKGEVVVTQEAMAALYEAKRNEWRVKAFKQYLEEIMPAKQYQRVNHFQKCLDTVSSLVVAVRLFGHVVPYHFERS